MTKKDRKEGNRERGERRGPP